MNQKLLFARAYEREASRQIPEMARPKFHLSPCTGWMNDPNGFSFYKGEYHLFYQYNPYDTCWDTMHWGHAVSGDLLSWRYLPAAMAPNEWYDADGCWSGSAMEMPDGRQLLMYTGNRREGGATRENLQVQCLALGDGIDYEKYAGNPVLTAADLPDECSPYDFRDPSIWRESDGTYRAIVGTCTKERLGKLLLFSSEDGLRWRFESVFAENDGRLGLMWECPDFFMLDGKAVLLVSPQDMLPQDFEYHNGNGTVAFIGHLDGLRHRLLCPHHHSDPRRAAGDDRLDAELGRLPKRGPEGSAVVWPDEPAPGAVPSQRAAVPAAYPRAGGASEPPGVL